MIAYNQSFLRNSRSQAEDSEEWEDDEDEYYDDSDDDDDDEEDGFDYGDTSFGTIKRTSKNRKQDRVGSNFEKNSSPIIKALLHGFVCMSY